MERYLALQKILETGGFTKAAKAMGYSQSSISQMIASLENELGIKLLTRSKGGAHLTIEGERIYPDIEKLLASSQAVKRKAADIRGLNDDVIRIGTISSITCHWMPQLIQGFQKQYPNVQFVFQQGDYSLIPEWIRSGKVDCGFISPVACGELQYDLVKSGEMLAVLPEKHPLASADRVSLEDLAQEPFLELEEGSYSEIMEAFKKAGLTPKVKYRLHDDYAIMTMVEAGLGVSVLAKLILDRTSFRNVCLPLNPPVSRTLAIAYVDKEELPLADKLFIKYLLDHKEDLP
ncbi:LysR family transcriptional regulator [Lactobacillus nasalidis]|uniref:LysR family transcriptional regulator n=1 Tax=Lactobacillus nasalidis TaxID=2797258 RepID=A0ABQ3W651_9LACO|nr:LysR family transcriptional regulator [Lactobacillus nasalidis]GHV97782.1 LysR family transcriptional regulator [Lactobacillus nasalidis]GHV99459.1 LysR family transcriptional regulator [Lactobacillus nasalidis]GHW01946.1 LysR family transcriptional regulator [Lactobacillus nasalidis]